MFVRYALRTSDAAAGRAFPGLGRVVACEDPQGAAFGIVTR